MWVEQYEIPGGLLYDVNNYWVKIDADRAIIGITAYGQSTIGDVLYLEIPRVEQTIQRTDELGSIEAGKWVGKLHIPISGTIQKINHELQANPRNLNQDPYGEGWLMEIELHNPLEKELLLKPEHYARWVREQMRREKEEEGIS